VLVSRLEVKIAWVQESVGYREFQEICLPPNALDSLLPAVPCCLD